MHDLPDNPADWLASLGGSPPAPKLIDEMTLPEITQYIEDTYGFNRDHVIDLREEGSWHLEHPMRCRLMQYDRITNKILPLRETCAVNHAMESGFAFYLRKRYGKIRLNLSPAAIHNIMQQHEEEK